MNRIFADRFCLFANHFKQFFVKFANQNFPSARIFVSSETTKFLFTLQAQRFAYIVLQKKLICTQFSCIWIAFWPKNPNGWTYSAPSYSLAVGNTHLFFADHLIYVYILYKLYINACIYICMYQIYIYIYIYILYQRHIQNHVKHLRWSFIRK